MFVASHKFAEQGIFARHYFTKHMLRMVYMLSMLHYSNRRKCDGSQRSGGISSLLKA